MPAHYTHIIRIIPTLYYIIRILYAYYNTYIIRILDRRISYIYIYIIRILYAYYIHIIPILYAYYARIIRVFYAYYMHIIYILYAPREQTVIYCPLLGKHKKRRRGGGQQSKNREEADRDPGNRSTRRNEKKEGRAKTNTKKTHVFFSFH